MLTTKDKSKAFAALPHRLADRKQINRLACLCMIVYFTSYVTRINYGAVVSEIVASEGIPKDAASLAVTGLFITYGVGQLVSGWLGDRISPKYLMFAGMVLATAMNLLLPLYVSPYYMLAVWCVNGFGQALMWPPIVKLLTNYLSSEDYVRATVVVSWGSSLGTIVIYLIAPLFITFSGWRSLFFFSAAVGTVGAVLCLVGVSAVERRAHAECAAGKTADGAVDERGSPEQLAEPTGKAGSVRALLPILVSAWFAIALQGSLRDGVTTWMPSYIAETFHLGTSISILTGVLLPVFSLICINITRPLYIKWIHDEFKLSGVMFAAATAAAGVLVLLSGASPVISVVCSTVIVGCMHGINLMLVCVLPGRFKRTGNISTISGVLNFATYVGAALSTYGFAALSERVGWHGTILLWLAVTVCGTVICFLPAFVKRASHKAKKQRPPSRKGKRTL